VGDTTIEQHKEISRRLVEEVFNGGRLELVDKLVASGFVGHDPSSPEPTAGPAGLRERVAGYRSAFPDLTITIEEQIIEGDRVVTRWTGRGTHEGELFGIAATGKQATVSGITIDRIAGGRIVESWTSWDTLGLLQQLGAVQEPARA
jgi:steroid delta-isomerase-like uncharacterized protein